MKADVGSYVVDDEGIKSTMKRCWDENGYLLCPHTSVGAKYDYNHKYVPLLLFMIKGHSR